MSRAKTDQRAALGSHVHSLEVGILINLPVLLFTNFDSIIPPTALQGFGWYLVMSQDLRMRTGEGTFRVMEDVISKRGDTIHNYVLSCSSKSLEHCLVVGKDGELRTSFMNYDPFLAPFAAAVI